MGVSIRAHSNRELQAKLSPVRSGARAYKCDSHPKFVALMVVWGCARGATVARYLRGNRIYGALQCELLTVSGILWKQCFAA